MTGYYQDIPFWRFALAVAVVAVPLSVLEEDRWQWMYVAIILLGAAIGNWPGVVRFAQFLNAELRRG